MKFRFKFLLFLCIVFVGIYTATPLWLAYILSKQLPTGWQLEKLDSGYPGLSGIGINVLRVKGDLQSGAVTVAASDLRFTYRGLKTDIDAIAVDVFLRATDNRSSENLTLNDLSLPITNLTGQLPALSVNRLRLSLHPALDSPGFGPLELQFDVLKLAPEADNGFYLNTDVSLVGNPDMTGRVDVDVSYQSLTAEIRFAASRGTGTWLSVWLEQNDHELNTATRIHTVVNTDLVDQQWLDSILARGTGDVITHVSGKLEAQADFSGQDQQRIEQLSLSTEKLQATVAGLTLGFDAELVATNEDEKVTVQLPGPVEIQYQDKTGRLADLLQSAIPGLQRKSDGGARPDAKILMEINPNSSIVIQTKTTQSIGFNGNIKLDYSSVDTKLRLRADDLNIGVLGFSGPDAITADGLLTLEWQESTPFAYTSDDLVLKADRLSLTSKGYLRLNHQAVEFEQAGRFEMQSENMRARLLASDNWLALDSETYAMGGRLDFRLSTEEPDAPVMLYFKGPVTANNAVITLPGDVPAVPTMLRADTLSISADLSSRDGGFVSTGSGTLRGSHISPDAISARQLDITWQGLDLLNMSGHLSTKTQGFSTRFEGETWSGFDFDMSYSLLRNEDIHGSGTLLFDTGPQLAFEFNGNSKAERWNITLPSATIKLKQMGGLLATAHYELPASVKFADGAIDLQGDVIVGENITARLTIGGRELGATMLENRVDGVNFRFDTVYGEALSANGPVSVTSAVLAGGVDVLDIGVDLNLDDAETIGLKNLRANLFDGRLNLEHLQFLNNRVQDTTAELSHIDLGLLLAFTDVDGLAGSGILEFSLPIGSDQTGVYIKNGTFNSTGPGHLAYTKEGVAGSNIGLQALENFQYQDLSGTLDYQSDGSYLISVHIEGKNPDLYGGHPIVFNLNINGSLPELFEALFMTGDFDQSILERIRTN